MSDVSVQQIFSIFLRLRIMYNFHFSILMQIRLLWFRTRLFIGIGGSGFRYQEQLKENIILWRYRYRLYHTNQHRTGTNNYRYSNGKVVQSILALLG